MGQIGRDQQQALLTSLGRAQEAFLKDAGFDPAGIAAIRRAGDQTGLSGDALDMRQLHFTLSHLKRQLRHADKGVDPDGFRSSDIRSLIGAIEEQIRTGQMVRRGGAPVSAEDTARIRLAWRAANDNTAIMHANFDNANMRELLSAKRARTPEGTVTDLPNMPAGLVRNRIFKRNDARFLSDSLDAIGNDPAVIKGLGEELEKLYRDTVLKDGRFQQGLHNAFVNDYSDHLRLLFGETGSARIRDVASFGRTVDIAEANLKRLEADLAQTFGKNVADPTQPLNIANEILSDRVTKAQARNLINRLDRNFPQLAESVRRKTLERIFDDVTTTSGQRITSKQLNSLIRDNGGTLTALFGKEYVDDLRLMKDIVGISDLRAFAKPGRQQAQPAFLQVSRSLLGPLSKKQRFITAVTRLVREEQGRRAIDILSNPGALRRFIAIRRMEPTDPRFITTIATLGLMDFAPDETKQAFQRLQQGNVLPSVEELRELSRRGPQ